MAKTAGKKAPKTTDSAPVADRPRMAKIYSVPKHKKGLLPWSYVQERLTDAKVYWVSTVNPDNTPHSTPMDGLWLDDALYFGGDPTTRRNRNLAINPATSVHLEDGNQVVILEGVSTPLRADTPGLVERLMDANEAKYGYRIPGKPYSTPGMYFIFRPRVAFAWSRFPSDVTRWEFKG